MVESADPPENDRVLEMEPSYVISIQDSIGDSKIMGMSKIDCNPESYDYFIQVINDSRIYLVQGIRHNRVRKIVMCDRCPMDE